MSGVFPTSPAPSSMTVHSLQPTRVSTSHNLRRQVRGGTVQQWAFDLSWEAMTRTELAPILAFALQQRGQFDTFTFTPPVMGTAQSAAAGTPLVNGATASGRSIPTDGWAPNVTVLKAGDFVKFASHSKVYMLTANAVSDGIGQATLSIEPALYASVVDNSAVTHAAVPFTCAFAGDTQELGVTPPFIGRYACKLVEVF